jgi:hypothetical protein
MYNGRVSQSLKRKLNIMGRKKKYNTLEDKRQAKNELRMKYYWNNADNEREAALKRYYTKKKERSL